MKLTRICIDLDEVVANWYEGICDLYDVKPWPYPFPVNEWDFYNHPPIGKPTEEVKKLADENFYFNLQKTAYADELVLWAKWMVGKENTFFLSTPWHNNGCCDGKRRWVDKNYPGYLKRTFLGSHKWIAAFPGSLLIDDKDDNIEEFKKYGGGGLLIPRPWNKRCDEVKEDGSIDIHEIIRQANTELNVI